MTVRVIARMLLVVFAAVLLLGACSSSSKSSGSPPSVDPRFKALVDTGTVPPDTGVSVPSSAQLEAISKVDSVCLGDELLQREVNGDFTLDDMSAWTAGIDPDGPVQQAALEILTSGKCVK